MIFLSEWASLVHIACRAFPGFPKRLSAVTTTQRLQRQLGFDGLVFLDGLVRIVWIQHLLLPPRSWTIQSQGERMLRERMRRHWSCVQSLSHIPNELGAIASKNIMEARLLQ
jgi:hypothetical protein